MQTREAALPRKLLLLLFLAALAGFVGMSFAGVGTALAVVSPSCPVDEYGNCMPDLDSGGSPTLDSQYYGGWDSTCAGSKYSNVWHLRRGLWPYNQDVYLHTTWCGQGGTGGTITYWTSWTTHDSFFCSGFGDYAYLVSGGRGYGQVTIEGGAYFTCPTSIPWASIHKHRWMQIRYYPDGYSKAVAWG